MKSWLWNAMLAAAIALPAVEFGYAREREHAATCTLATL